MSQLDFITACKRLHEADAEAFKAVQSRLLDRRNAVNAVLVHDELSYYETVGRLLGLVEVMSYGLPKHASSTD